MLRWNIGEHYKHRKGVYKQKIAFFQRVNDMHMLASLGARTSECVCRALPEEGRPLLLRQPQLIVPCEQMVAVEAFLEPIGSETTTTAARKKIVVQIPTGIEWQQRSGVELRGAFAQNTPNTARCHTAFVRKPKEQSYLSFFDTEQCSYTTFYSEKS